MFSENVTSVKKDSSSDTGGNSGSSGNSDDHLSSNPTTSGRFRDYAWCFGAENY